MVRYALLLTLVVSASAYSNQYVVTPKPGINSTAVYDTVGGAEVQRLNHGETLPWFKNIPWYYEVRLPNGNPAYVRKGYARRMLATTTDTNEMRIHFLHTGAGSCALVECPASEEVMMIDCGSWSGDVDTNFHRTEAETAARVKQILGDTANQRPMNVVLSHGDYDHYSEINTVLKGYNVGHLWLGGFSNYYSSSGFPTWKADMVSSGTTVHEDLEIDFHNVPAQPEPNLSCGAASTFILTNRAKGNTQPKKSDRNANSMVVMIEHGDFRVIFSGDATSVTEKEVMENFPDVSATVVAASHHGATSHGSNHIDWAKKLKARAVVYSSGHRYGHPKCGAVERFAPYVANVPNHPGICDSSETKPFSAYDKAHYMTEAVGDVTIKTNGTSPFYVECQRESCAAEISH